MEFIAKRLLTFRDAILANGVEGTVTYRGELSHFVRCGCNRISLATSEKLASLEIEIQSGKKAISGSVTFGVSDQPVLDLIAKLADRLPHMPDNQHLPEIESLPPAGSLPDGELVYPFESSEAVAVFEAAINEFGARGEISGAYSCGVSEYAVCNTASTQINGARVEDSNCEVVLFLADSGKELRSASCGRRPADIKGNEIIATLRRNLQLKDTTPREDLEPGEYPVIFHADAVGEMIQFLGWTAFSGESYDLQNGFIDKHSEKPGMVLFDEKVTIFDDPEDPRTVYRRTAGLNGMPRPKFPLITEGKLEQFFYSDRAHAKRYDRKVNNDQWTGSPVMVCGDGPGSFDEMVKSIKEPTIYVSYIHYMNLTNSTLGEFTGVSRFGTFLIADGEVKAHLYNLRLNDSLKRLFNNVDWVGSSARAVDFSTTYDRRSPDGVSCPEYVKFRDVKITATSKPKGE